MGTKDVGGGGGGERILEKSAVINFLYVYY